MKICYGRGEYIFKAFVFLLSILYSDVHFHKKTLCKAGLRPQWLRDPKNTSSENLSVNNEFNF